MFVTDSDVLDNVAAILKQADGALLISKAPWWSGIVALTHAQAYGMIRRALLARGYLISQVDAWDEGPEFERTIAVYQALVYNAVLSEAGKEFIEKAEGYLHALADVTLTIAGKVQAPAGTTGLPHTGAMQGYWPGHRFSDPEDDCWR